MATTGTQVFNKSMAIIDEISDANVINSADYIKQAPYIVDILQRELMPLGDLTTDYEFAYKPAENILGNYANFDNVEFVGTDLTYEANDQCQAYYFEANRAGTAYIEDYTSGWNTLATVTINGTTDQFTAYSGLVTPTSGATKSRIRLSGTYRYICRNRALYDAPFALAADVPAFGIWVEKTMPADFKSLDQVINEDEVNGYIKQSAIKWEGKNKLFISYYYSGNIRIIYKPIPIEITALTQTLQIDDITATTIMPYGLAAQLMVHEDPQKANFFQQRFEELKKAADKPMPAGETTIYDTYNLLSGM